MLLAYAIAVTLGCALLLIAQCRTWDQRDKARAEAEAWQMLHDRAHRGWRRALDLLDEHDPSGRMAAEAILAREDRLH
jgi:hypothetical protein